MAPVQLGVNAMTTAELMRVQYRLPFRLITQLMSDLPKLPVSCGAVARQVQRMAKWLEGEYDRLRIFLSSPAVNMDETSWRVDGQNGWLWTLLDPTHTLFHRYNFQFQRFPLALHRELRRHPRVYPAAQFRAGRPKRQLLYRPEKSEPVDDPLHAKRMTAGS